MSESASAAFAARSASAERSAGTRRNSFSDAGQIQLSSISNGFSSSCTLCKLRAAAQGWSTPPWTADSYVWEGDAGCWPRIAHFGNLHDSLLAGHVLQLQPLYFRLRCLTALTDRCAEVPLSVAHAQARSVLERIFG